MVLKHPADAAEVVGQRQHVGPHVDEAETELQLGGQGVGRGHGPGEFAVPQRRRGDLPLGRDHPRVVDLPDAPQGMAEVAGAEENTVDARDLGDGVHLG